MSSSKETTPLLSNDTAATTTIGASAALDLRNWLRISGLGAEETIPTAGLKAAIFEAEAKFSQLPFSWQRIYAAISVATCFNLLIVVAMYTAQEACGWNSGKGRALGIYNLVVSALMFFGVVFVATYHTTRDQKPLPARICRIACGVGTAAVFSHMIVVIALFSVQENKGGEDGRLLGIYSLVVSILLFLALGFGGSYYVGLKRGMGVRGYGSIVETE